MQNSGVGCVVLISDLTSKVTISKQLVNEHTTPGSDAERFGLLNETALFSNSLAAYVAVDLFYECFLEDRF